MAISSVCVIGYAQHRVYHFCHADCAISHDIEIANTHCGETLTLVCFYSVEQPAISSKSSGLASVFRSPDNHS